jgi:hypothetical protein
VRHARKPENQTLYRSTNFGSYVSYTNTSVMYAGREHVLCALFREHEITYGSTLWLYASKFPAAVAAIWLWRFVEP